MNIELGIILKHRKKTKTMSILKNIKRLLFFKRENSFLEN